MRIVYFTHSLTSCWNQGNAHFLRGVLRELIALGHAVEAYEPVDAWSRANLVRDQGDAGLDASLAPYPDLTARRYTGVEEALEHARGADLVIVHEWNAPELIAGLGRTHRRGAYGVLLFHDTHHRAVSEPEAMARYDLSGFDGVLAFGAALAEVYRARGWGSRAFVWHEAADTRLFHPPAEEETRQGLIWIGNWGDGERSRELETFLLRPARAAGLSLDIHGVRYPDEALAMLRRYSAEFKGWAPNAAAPGLFARHLATVHVPRRFYVEALPGIPTIRVFEALACGIPLACAPWDDAEGLFTPGADYLLAPDGPAMERALRDLANDAPLRASLAAHGLSTIRARHTCCHRAEELLAIHASLRAPDLTEAVA